MRFLSILVLIQLTQSAHAQTAAHDSTKCKVYFAIVDPNGHVIEMTKGQQWWYPRKGVKKYPIVCYVPEKATYWLMLRTAQDIYSKSVTVTRTIDIPEKGNIEIKDRDTGRTSEGTYSGTVSVPVETQKTIAQYRGYARVTVYKTVVIDGKPFAQQIGDFSRIYEPSHGGQGVIGVFHDLKTDEPDRRVLEDALMLITTEVAPKRQK